MYFSSVESVHFHKEYFHQSKEKHFKKDEHFDQKNQKLLKVVLQKIDLLEDKFGGLLASACIPKAILQNVLRKKQT